MPFTVLKVSKTDEKQIEVLGEFPDGEIAKKFAELIQNDEASSRYEYVVEPPYRASSSERRATPLGTDAARDRGLFFFDILNQKKDGL